MTDEIPLSGILPESIRKALAGPPHFSIATAQGVLAPVRLPADGPGARYRLGDSGLVAQVQVTVDPEHRVAVQSLALVNEGHVPSPPIHDLSTLALTLQGGPHVRPELHWVQGGLTHHIYPPLAYRESTASFGARSSLGRGGRHALASGPDGRSSNQDLPILQVQWVEEHRSSGFWAALEWSGTWTLGLERLDRAAWRFCGGPQVNGVVLDPGETLVLPDSHLGLFEGDIEEGGNSARRYVYDRICPDYDGQRPLPPISYDHWFGVGERIDEAFLMKQVDACAELGMEFWVLDASWFPGAKQSFSHGVGNWERVDAAKFPNGLEPLAEYVRQKGMKFGLWFEVERAHRSSDWAQQHPSWFYDTGEEYLHLDLAQGEVQDAVIALLDGWIRRLDLRWSRWDYNIGPKPYWDRVDPTGKVQFAYMRGLYRVLDALRARHPQWLIEACASGGRRIDFGTLRRAHTVWFSDHSADPHVCRLMQTGAARYLPGQLTNSSVEVPRGEGDGRFDDAAILSRMAGAFSIDGDVATWSKARLRQVRKLIDHYRGFRHLLVKDCHRLTPYPRSMDDWDVVQFTDPATTESVILAYRVAGDDGQVVLPRGLRGEGTYEVISPLDGTVAMASGRSLMRDGLTLRLPQDGATVRRLVPRPVGQA